MKSNGLNKLAMVVAKILEVCHWVGTALMAAALVAYFIREEWMDFFAGMESGLFSIRGYSVNIWSETGVLLRPVFVPAMIAGILVLGLSAMIFRNIYLIFKTSAGKTKFSEGATPFQKNNVRMVREIGIFSIAIPVVETICDVIARAAANADLSSSVSLVGVVLGIAMLCLSQFFAYGVELQAEADGLV